MRTQIPTEARKGSKWMERLGHKNSLCGGTDASSIHLYAELRQTGVMHKANGSLLGLHELWPLHDGTLSILTQRGTATLCNSNLSAV